MKSSDRHRHRHIAGEGSDAAAMGFWSDVQWWEDWQLRFLVLASLFFQYFLFAAALLRQRRVPPWFRSLIWLAYQGGDVVAVYALATLFNRHRKDEVAAGAAHLDTLWAPVLLLHLGGQDGITAYSVEDNENWRRHLLVAASQVSARSYGSSSSKPARLWHLLNLQETPQQINKPAVTRGGRAAVMLGVISTSAVRQMSPSRRGGTEMFYP